MSLIVAALLASNQALPFIDRSALRTLAEMEAIQGEHPVKTLAARNDRDVAHLCSTAANLATPSRTAIGRAYSMFGPEVSILKQTCALRTSSSTWSMRVAAR